MQFPFNLKDDRVASVAQEMVHELSLDPAGLEDLKRDILAAIKKAIKDACGQDWVEGTVPAADEGARAQGPRLSVNCRSRIVVFAAYL